MLNNLYGRRGKEEIDAFCCSYTWEIHRNDRRAYIFMDIDTSLTQHISHNGNGKTPVATHSVYLALGSNLGDRRAPPAVATRRPAGVMACTTAFPGCFIVPGRFTKQTRFLNTVTRGVAKPSPP